MLRVAPVLAQNQTARFCAARVHIIGRMLTEPASL
jgi:hypothetical protein